MVKKTAGEAECEYRDGCQLSDGAKEALSRGGRTGRRFFLRNSAECLIFWNILV